MSGTGKGKVTDDSTCIKCTVVIRGIPGTRRIVETEEEAQRLKDQLNKNVNVGDSFCHKCKKKVKFDTKDPVTDPVPAVMENPGSTDEITRLASGLSLTPLESQSSGGSVVIPSPDPEPVIRETVKLALRRPVSTHKYCCICYEKTSLVDVPFQARLQCFGKKTIFIPRYNRCCKNHLLVKRKQFYGDVLEHMPIHSTESTIDISELTIFMELLSARTEATLLDSVGMYSISEKKLKVFTGLEWENMNYLENIMTTMRNSRSRTITQALITFLFKLRSGNSNAMVASILGIEREQKISEFCNSVLNSFDKDILPTYFGLSTITRKELIDDQTSQVAKKLHNLEGKLALIFDGTYVRHEKSSNNAYQRKSYSGQKKVPLCKPFTICTTNGFVVDVPGPFYATQNDATIMKTIFEDPDGVRKIMKSGDYCIVDRGFRDVTGYLESLGYTVLMPALKGKRKQLTTEEANGSRLVTKVRWPVEGVHGVISKKYKLLHHQLDNKLLPHVGLYCRIVCFLNNKFGKRMDSDAEMIDEIVERLRNPRNKTNTLAQEVETERWATKSKLFSSVTAESIIDFPELTERDLKLLFTGTYQLGLAISYLAEMMGQEETVNLQYLKATKNILKLLIQSRHKKSKMYKCFIDYKPNAIGCDSISRYTCECAHGLRTVGCCAHVATIIYYLAHARYKSKIVKPAAHLTQIFDVEGYDPVIQEDSENDD